ncbi:YopX family protein [Enterococcus sp. H57]|uniref:YopX family protein n=1 Tax=Enterococcus sp. H57 TaxID=2035004 RepID=UPI000D593090|nr:YopX family protein [Enterococcus sp. H57]
MRFNDEIVIWSGQVYINEKKELDAKIKGFSCLPEYLMQSTGMKDKNGVEIFEGDVVSVSMRNGFDYLDNKVCIVKNSIGHSGLVCATVDEDLEYRIFNTELFEEYTYEVIGNIYENSELLEEQ